MSAYPLRLRPTQRITIHAARRSAEGARTACRVHLDLIGPAAAHSEPTIDVTCLACRESLAGEAS